ncbi:MAG TPA: hypothetical protein VGP79_09395 [Bryobacteraceae bacterium]|nr:hypothetical protein [Bryobacteraceae bacterium]
MRLSGAVRFLSVTFVCAALLARSAHAQSAQITTLAGATPANGFPIRGFTGDGPATQARLALANVQNTCDPVRYEQITHLAVDSIGNIFFADSDNQRIRRIDTQGNLTTIAGSGSKPATNSLCEPTSSVNDGPANSAIFYNPASVALAANGDLIIADQQNNRIRRLSNGTVSTIVGNGQHLFYAPGIPATATPMDWPAAVAFGPGNTLYFAELHGNRVAKLAADGTLVTVAGSGFPGFAGDNGRAVTAQLHSPSGIAFDAAGNLYIADQLNNRIRKVTPDGIISTVAGTSSAGFSGDGGKATSASLSGPMDVASDAAGNLYIADTLNHRIRKVDTSGNISTVAGDGRIGRGPDNVAANTSSLNSPSGVALDASGNLYIVDWQNYLIRKVTFPAPPAINRGGIANAASFAPSPLAPGSLISIFGTNLATGASTLADGAPWKTQMSGARVTLNGTDIPLYYVSGGQINAELPYGLADGAYALTVTTSAGTSAPEPFTVAAAAPGIFMTGSPLHGLVQNQDFDINRPGHAEQRGNIIVAYLTGIGSVAPPIREGDAAPFDRLLYATLPYSATMDGVSADVQFLGLTPGYIGLAQANIKIPDGATIGESILVITVNGQPSKPVTVFVK